MEVLGISTVFMFVSDVPRSREYYASILGKDPAREREGMLASFDLGGISLLLHSDANATWLPAGAKKGVGVALHFESRTSMGIGRVCTPPESTFPSSPHCSIPGSSSSQ